MYEKKNTILTYNTLFFCLLQITTPAWITVNTSGAPGAPILPATPASLRGIFQFRAFTTCIDSQNHKYIAGLLSFS